MSTDDSAQPDLAPTTSAILRAAADRFILDGANVLYIVGGLQDADLDARCEATGWTVAELLGRLTADEEAWAAQLGAEDAVAAPADPGEPPAAALARRFAAARRRLIAAILALPEERAALPLDPAGTGEPLVRTVFGWSLHSARHALDFLEALPALREDGFVLNWALPLKFADDPRWEPRRTALVKQIRARLDRKARAKRRRNA